MTDCICKTCRPEMHHRERSSNDSWDLTAQERSTFLMVASTLELEQRKSLPGERPHVPLEDLLSDHETRDLFRNACEKLMARADSRRVMTNSQKELKYLKGRIHAAKGWLKFGLTHKLWGSIVDGYSELDNGRVPPVKTWQAAGEWVADDGVGLVVTPVGKAKAKARAKKKAQPKKR